MITIKQAVGKQAAEQVANRNANVQQNASGTMKKFLNKKTLLIIGGVVALGAIGFIIWKKMKSGSDANVLDLSSAIADSGSGGAEVPPVVSATVPTGDIPI